MSDYIVIVWLILIVAIWLDTRINSAPAPDDQHASVMPQKVTDQAERKLYLEPGGRYTEADIEANGRRTASEVFAGFRARHDIAPQAGDRLCPITHTKANSSCTWIIDGLEYQFCCPPCIDEFIELAKRHPDQIRAPESYAK
jgi:hypothetical protein